MRGSAGQTMGRAAKFVSALTLFGALALTAAQSAQADATHVVARGHTIESIANRYHVPVKAIVEANKLKHPNRLKVGETLIIPGVKDVGGKGGAAAKDSAKGAKVGEPKPDAKKKPATYAMKAKTPGVLHLARLATSEEATFRAADKKGHTAPAALKQMEKLLRSTSGQTKPINPRLVALATIVSDHFGSRKIEVISGFRPYSPTQHTAHSNHNVGNAMDFRVVGVPNEVVRDFCKTLRNVGVGYYPNSTFVHLDVRPQSAFWIDYSRPGEPPRYNDPNVVADEGTSDVGADVLMTPPATEGGTTEPAAGANPAPSDGEKPTPSPTTTEAPSPAAPADDAKPKAGAAAPAAPSGTTATDPKPAANPAN